MRGESHTKYFLRAIAACLVLTGLAGCESIAGPGEPPSAEQILLKKAEDRVSTAQDSLNDANDLIAAGQKQKAEGDRLSKEGDARIRAGMTLKSAAEQDLASARNQASSARQRAQIYSPTEEGAAAAPVPQSRPVTSY